MSVRGVAGPPVGANVSPGDVGALVVGAALGCAVGVEDGAAVGSGDGVALGDPLGVEVPGADVGPPVVGGDVVGGLVYPP